MPASIASFIWLQFLRLRYFLRTQPKASGNSFDTPLNYQLRWPKRYTSRETQFYVQLRLVGADLRLLVASVIAEDTSIGPWLRVALDETGDEWPQLQELCSQEAFAGDLLRALKAIPGHKDSHAVHWMEVIQEMHPRLRGGLESATPAASPEEPARPAPSFLAQCRSLPALFARFVSPRRGL